MFRSGAILILLCILCCDHQATAEAESSYNASFIDSKHGYSFSYPSQWKARLYKSGIVVSEVNSPNGGAGVQFRITDYDKSDEGFTDTYIDKVGRDLKAGLLTKNYLTINGMECLELEFSANRSGTIYHLYQLIYFVSDVSKMVIIQAGCKSDNKTTIAPIIQYIGKSLILLDKNKL